jgi:putative ABC transport system substrate-binding protein
MPVIGYINVVMPSPTFRAGWLRGLGEMGYVEGKNVAIEYHSADGRYDLLPDLARQVANRRVDLIVTGGGTAVALAAKRATATIPIVFLAGGDPVADGVVASLARPGANITGVTFLTVELEPKRMELLLELIPKAKSLALLDNPNNPMRRHQIIDDLGRMARAVRAEFEVLNAGTASEIDAAFAELDRKHCNGLLVGSDVFYLNHRDQLVALASRYGIPAIYEWREYVASGGLASYGTSNTDTGRLIGIYCGRILKGARPADLPVQQPTKFELAINLKTAKALSIVVPQTMLDRADEVIE